MCSKSSIAYVFAAVLANGSVATWAEDDDDDDDDDDGSVYSSVPKLIPE